MHIQQTVNATFDQFHPCQIIRKCSKISVFFFLFYDKMLVIKACNYKMFIRIANREDHDQTSTDPCLHYLPWPFWERSGSVVECLTLDRGVACSSLTCITALCP